MSLSSSNLIEELRNLEEQLPVRMLLLFQLFVADTESATRANNVCQLG